MDFADILEKWEKRTPGSRVYDKDFELEASVSRKRNGLAERRSRLLRKKPDAYIDLHGLNKDEAWIALEKFFENSRSMGLEKVLIIHGKGSHGSCIPSGEGMLRNLSRRFIEFCPFAGESGYSTASEGGRGATWVIIKEAD
jgi:DNA-nicking Smr family endonuclease